MGKMTSGFVKINRDILKEEFYKKPIARSLFFHILLTANIRKSTLNGVEIPVGARATSLTGLSKETGFSVQNVRTGLLTLKSTGLLTVSKHAKFSVIAVENWGSYQMGQQARQQANQHGNQQQNEEYSRNEEERGMNSSPSDIDKDWLKEWKSRL